MYKSNNQRKCIIDIETSDYLPWNGSKIICIGIINLSTSTKHVFYNENEAKLLSSFIEYFESKDFTNIIGYNVAFDVRFLFSRCLKYQLSAKTLYHAKINDLIKIVSLSVQDKNFNKPGKLGEWSSYLFNKTTLYSNGSIKQLFSKGKIDEIIAHNHRDLDLTYQLWKRIEETLHGVIHNEQ